MQLPALVQFSDSQRDILCTLQPIVPGGLWTQAVFSPRLIHGIDLDRPADVLVVPNLALARQQPDENRAVRSERVCLHFAVINALGPDHWAQTVHGGRCGG